MTQSKEVVERAYQNGVKYLALTDHDTVSGLDNAIQIAKEINISFIPGIELSTTHNKESVHILGFFKDDSYMNDEFIHYLQTLKDKRKIRAEKMIQKLKEVFNIEISLDNVLKRGKDVVARPHIAQQTLKDKRKIRAEKMIQKLKEVFNIEISLDNVLKRGKDVVARPHIAQEIIASGYPYEFEYIFQNFIGKDCPAFVPTTKLTTEEGVKLLKKYNALVFLAHPKLIHNSPLEDYLNMGFDGIEAIYFQNTPDEEKYFLNFAKKHNLLVSAGSDCHGNVDGDERHGDIGAMNITEDLLETFLEKYNTL